MLRHEEFGLNGGLMGAHRPFLESEFSCSRTDLGFKALESVKEDCDSPCRQGGSQRGSTCSVGLHLDDLSFVDDEDLALMGLDGFKSDGEPHCCPEDKLREHATKLVSFTQSCQQAWLESASSEAKRHFKALHELQDAAWNNAMHVTIQPAKNFDSFLSRQNDSFLMRPSDSFLMRPSDSFLSRTESFPPRNTPSPELARTCSPAVRPAHAMATPAPPPPGWTVISSPACGPARTSSAGGGVASGPSPGRAVRCAPSPPPKASAVAAAGGGKGLDEGDRAAYREQVSAALRQGNPVWF